MYPAAGEAVKAADAPDQLLHAAITASGSVLHIRGRYMLAKLGDARLDEFRSLVLDILQVRRFWSAPRSILAVA